MSQEDRINVVSDVPSDSDEINAQSTTQHQQSLQLIKLNFFHNPQIKIIYITLHVRGFK
jgi:hypothetical protein